MKKQYVIPALRDLVLAQEWDFLASRKGDFDEIEGEDYDVEW